MRSLRVLIAAQRRVEPAECLQMREYLRRLWEPLWDDVSVLGVVM